MRIEEDLMSEIRQRAAAEHLSINRMINRLLRAGLDVDDVIEPPFKQTTHAMGAPKVDLTKKSAVLAALDDAAFLEKMRKQ